MKIYRMATPRGVRWLLTTKASAVRQARLADALGPAILHCVDFMGSPRQRRGVVEMLNSGLLTLDWDRLLPEGRSSGYYTLPDGEGDYLGYGWRSAWRRQGITPHFYAPHAAGAGGEYRHVIWAIYAIPLRRSRTGRPPVPIEVIEEPAGLPPPPYQRRRLTSPSPLSEGRRDVAR